MNEFNENSSSIDIHKNNMDKSNVEIFKQNHKIEREDELHLGIRTEQHIGRQNVSVPNDSESNCESEDRGKFYQSGSSHLSKFDGCESNKSYMDALIGIVKKEPEDEMIPVFLPEDPSSNKDVTTPSDTNLDNAANSAKKQTNYSSITDPKIYELDKSEKECIQNIAKKPDNSKKTSNRPKRIYTTGEKIFPCKFCPKAFSIMSNLRRHLRTHTGEKPFSCNICGNLFSLSSHLKTHLNIHSGEKPYACEICKKKFASSSNLITHMRNHTGQKPYECTACDKKFNAPSRLVRHFRIHTGEKPYSCNVCSKEFSSSSNLTTHLRVHREKIPYGSNAWVKKFLISNNLTGNLPTDKTDNALSPNASNTPPIQFNNQRETSLYNCTECGKKFNLPSRLAKHMRTHTGEKQYGCNMCSKKFFTLNSLKMHIRIHIGEKPCICDNNEKKISSVSDLNTPLPMVSPETPCTSIVCYKKDKCDICGKKFSLPRHLKVHLRIHTGEKPFACATCGKKFNTSSSLKRHIRTHTGEQPYSCNVCGKKFSLSENLSKHLRIHARKNNVAVASENQNQPTVEKKIDNMDKSVDKTSLLSTIISNVLSQNQYQSLIEKKMNDNLGESMEKVTAMSTITNVISANQNKQTIEKKIDNEGEPLDMSTISTVHRSSETPF